MAKRFDISDMPPQTEELHQTVRWIERKYGKALEECIAGYDVHDPLKLVEVTRTYATQFFDAYYDFYVRFPDYAKYSQEASVFHAFTRVLQQIDNYRAVRSFYKNDQKLLMRVRKTIEKHGESKIPVRLDHAFTGLESAKQSSASVWAEVSSEETPTLHPATSPKDLHAKYRITFPLVKILDICWAAHQTHREWKRWMSGDYVPGNTPDRSFRKVLTSGEDARDLRKEPRPKGWK